MKRKLNLIALLAISTVMSTAYGTVCYLEQTVCCVKYTDAIGNHTIPNDGHGCTGTANFYANEDAWRIDVYSVTRGGRADISSISTICDKASADGYSPAPRSVGGGFQVFYNSPCNGSDFTADNNTGLYYSVTTHYLNNPSGACN